MKGYDDDDETSQDINNDFAVLSKVDADINDSNETVEKVETLNNNDIGAAIILTKDDNIQKEDKEDCQADILSFTIPNEVEQSMTENVQQFENPTKLETEQLIKIEVMDPESNSDHCIDEEFVEVEGSDHYINNAETKANICSMEIKGDLQSVNELNLLMLEQYEFDDSIIIDEGHITPLLEKGQEKVATSMENNLGNNTPGITLDGSNPENMKVTKDQPIGENKLIKFDSIKVSRDKKLLMKEPNFEVEPSSPMLSKNMEPPTLTINLIEKPNNTKKENSCASHCWH